MALLSSALRLQDDTLELFEYGESLVGVINLRVALLLTDEESNLFEPLKLALYIPGIFLDELCETTYVRFEVRILRIDHNNLATNS